MLKGNVIQPQILSTLGRAGHGSKILIADGNYPFSTRRGSNAELVFLNLSPGKLNVTDVLESLLTVVPVEEAVVMAPNRTGPYAMKTDPPIFAEFIKLLKKNAPDLDLKKVDRFAFYDLVSTSDTCLIIATGEQRIYANLLLTIGVVK
ncbi:MAG TPA: RbsD/FucU family protein [Phycisphaerae bacterium]|nr:RbsD/FucU family protein [Phycisphaerae bacterium]